MPDSTIIAHISDVHLTPLAGLSPRHFNLKRTLGLLNWHRSRKAVHRPEVVAQLIADMLTVRRDHIAVTGDLCNIGLPSEYGAARSWLESIGGPDLVTVVPGNHDIYTRLGHHLGVETWREYMRSDAFGMTVPGAGGAERGFPFVRKVRGVALVGVNSAIETRPFVAAGQVGRSQLAALEKVLTALASSGLARVVLIHHPPLPGQAPERRGLRDAAGFAELVARCGAELVLHGHNHRDSIVWCEGPTGKVPVIGIASGSAGRRHRGEPLARYNLVRVRRLADGPWSIEVTGRGLLAGGVEVGEIDRHVLTLAMA